MYEETKVNKINFSRSTDGLSQKKKRLCSLANYSSREAFNNTYLTWALIESYIDSIVIVLKFVWNMNIFIHHSSHRKIKIMTSLLMSVMIMLVIICRIRPKSQNHVLCIFLFTTDHYENFQDTIIPLVTKGSCFSLWGHLFMILKLILIIFIDN